jgi:uncharacterized protein (DUF488 family)
MSTAICTIGYEGIDIDAFLPLLRENGIETVVDVRELPLSRKPGFSKKRLSAALDRDGLGYIHLPELGCPKLIRSRYRADGNWRRYKNGFAKHLDTQHAAIAKLASLAASSNCALLCFEANFNRCHRSMVADAVKGVTGMRVSHIRVDEVRTAKSADLASAVAVADRQG